MTDTGSPADPTRLIPCYTNEGTLFRPGGEQPLDQPPCVPGPAPALVSTARDYLRFATCCCSAA